jgi:anion-transporting  ArsA/GET3 family ATPase
VFLRSIGALLDGFRTRAAGVKELLGAPTTTFLVVASPERGAVDEAIFFHGRLRDAGMPFGGLIVNRVHSAVDGDPDPEAVQAELTPSLGAALAVKVAASVRDARVLARRDAAAIARLQEEIGVDDPVVVPQLDRDVHDVDALVLVERYLRDEC